MLVEAPGSVALMHQSSYLSAQHARIAKRRGNGRAQVAVAHSILVSAWHTLSKDEPYKDLGADWLARRHDEAHARRLVAQLERFGHTVQLDTATHPPQSTTSCRVSPNAVTRLPGGGESRVYVANQFREGTLVLMRAPSAVGAAHAAS